MAVFVMLFLWYFTYIFLSTIFTLFYCYVTFFLLSRLPRDTFYNLKRLIRFNYNTHSIIITIFQRKKLSLSQLKGFIIEMHFLNKVDIYLKHFISTRTKFFHKTFWISKAVHQRYGLKSGPETRDLGPWDLGPGTLRPGTLGPWYPGTWKGIV